MRPLLLILFLSGCAGPNLDPAAAPAAMSEEVSAGVVRFVVVDQAVRPIAGASIEIGGLMETTDERGTAELVKPEPGTAWTVTLEGHFPAHGTIVDDVIRVVMQPLPPGWLVPTLQAYETNVRCSLNVLVPFGHACGLIDEEPEGNWQFTFEGDAPERSQLRVQYVADQVGNYLLRLVTTSSGTAGTGGQTIAELGLDDTDRGTLTLSHGEVGPNGETPLDVMAGYKIVIFVRGDVESPEPLGGTPAGHGIGARLDHRGQLFLQAWDPRGPVPDLLF